MTVLHLPIAKPCHEDWDAMDPEASGKFCNSCSKSVHDLTDLTEDEAKAVLAQHVGRRLCVRYNVDNAGTIRFRTAARVAVAGLALAACTPHDRPIEQRATTIETTPAPTVGTTPVVPRVVEPEVRPTMGEPPMIEPVEARMGDIAAPTPPPVQHVKGEIAVPNEPCDSDAKPPAAGPTKPAAGPA